MTAITTTEINPFTTVSFLRTVFARGIRTVAASVYDAERRAIVDVQRREYFAITEIAYIGKEEDGTWSLLTCEGKRFKRGIPNRASGMVAARRHFGADIMFG
ncbi:hypothetical protein AB0F77_39785 [Streptomyces sp. NPDC026672]|uniref:hypothetical protein n=1 Tax=Actinomycetes TaxID=1760 RepID=UPI003402736E